MRRRHSTFLLLCSLAAVPQSAAVQERPLAAGYWTRGLIGGGGPSWSRGVPGYGKTETDIAFVAFHPQLGRFLADHLEMYGEGTLLVCTRPDIAVSGGVAGLGGRYHFWGDRRWTPYVSGAAGLIWTSLTDAVPAIDRAFNFQILYGIGVRMVPPRGSGLMAEFRNHHISNADTAGENLGINARHSLPGCSESCASGLLAHPQPCEPERRDDPAGALDELETRVGRVQDAERPERRRWRGARHEVETAADGENLWRHPEGEQREHHEHAHDETSPTPRLPGRLHVSANVMPPMPNCAMFQNWKNSRFSSDDK